MRRFSFTKILSWVLALKVFQGLVGIVVYTIRGNKITLQDVLLPQGVPAVLTQVLLSPVIYCVLLNYLYRCLRQRSLSNLLQALSISFVLLLGYIALLMTMEGAAATVGVSLLALSLMVSAVFDCAILLGITYFFYVRDLRQKKTAEGFET